MTALEAYELTTQGGATDFARVIEVCRSFGPYCLIGGLAVNCYVEPVYTLDADVVVVSANLAPLAARLREQGFRTEEHPYSLDALAPASALRIQFTTDERYQEFLARAVDAEVLGIPARVACLEDVVRGKLWAYSDPQRRLSKRKKDELDLIRLAEAYPELLLAVSARAAGATGARLSGAHAAGGRGGPRRSGEMLNVPQAVLAPA